MTVLNREPKFNANMLYREHVLTVISATIEAKIGLAKPKICEVSSYFTNKELIVLEIKSKKHFCENDWSDCVKTFFDCLKPLQGHELEDIVSEDEEISLNDRVQRIQR
jgi:hypothetical protein